MAGLPSPVVVFAAAWLSAAIAGPAEFHAAKAQSEAGNCSRQLEKELLGK